jgi:hypothetical protein
MMMMMMTDYLMCVSKHKSHHHEIKKDTSDQADVTIKVRALFLSFTVDDCLIPINPLKSEVRINCV